MHPKEFLEVTEAKLLSHLGDQLHVFFSDRTPIWTSWDEAQKEAGPLKTLYQVDEHGKQNALPVGLQKLLYFKREEMNPASAVKPIAQCNMVANATFHLMAQQIAIVLHEMPNLDKEKVLQTSYDNIRKLVDKYLEMAKQETHNEDHDQGDQSRGSSPSGLSS
jgi:hypothetical protein